MMDKNMLKKVGFASFIMMASVFASRVIGVLREMAIAGVGGIKAGVDAYQIAFIIPEILNHIIASGFLSITFIPIFAHYLTIEDTEEGYRVFSNILNTFGSLLLVFIAASMIWTSELVKFFAPGIHSPETFSLAVKMTRIIIPAQFFFFCGGLLMAVQFAHEKFFIPALAPLIYNLFIIAGGLVLGRFIGMEGFAWGVLAGAFVGNFAIQFFGARKLGARFFFRFDFFHPDLIKYIKLSLPLMAGLTMTFSTEILLKYFGSFLDQGSIAAMNYSLRVMFILVGLFGQAVGVASYPFMAKLAEENNIRELNALLNKTLKFILLVIPVSTLFIALSHEIIFVLFKRGSFDFKAVAVTAGILPYFMAGAFAFSAQNIVSRGFYARQNTLFPAVLTTACVIFSLPVLFFMMKIWGAKGVAAGLSLAVMIQSFVLFESWSQKSANLEKRSVYAFFLKMLPLSAVIGLVLVLSVTGLRQLFGSSTFYGCLATCILAGIEFLCLFYGSGIFFKINEIRTIYANVRQKARLKGGVT